MKYINIKTEYGTETIDEFETRKEAREMIKEYQMVYAGTYPVWVSQRSTREWRESK